MMLYKYRSLSNLEYALDIFVNSRMHAAKFTELNDPMEGIYTYTRGQLTNRERRSLFDQKISKRILSLSETPNDMLMWSYYAEAHTGIVVGVTVEDPKATVEPVNYVDQLRISMRSDDVAHGILLKKLRLWKHEKEQRALIFNEDFVTVTVREVIFGLRSKEQTRDLVTEIAKRFCPGVEVRKILSDEIDKGTRTDLNF